MAATGKSGQSDPGQADAGRTDAARTDSDERKTRRSGPHKAASGRARKSTTTTGMTSTRSIKKPASPKSATEENANRQSAASKRPAKQGMPYSGTPLPKKLGLKPGITACFLNPPRGYFKLLGTLPSGLKKTRVLEGNLDFVQMFCKSESELAVTLPDVKKVLDWDGSVWVCWPKRSSGVSTDLSDAVVRRLGLSTGLVDVKVCAVDEVWSGLKFCFRKADRPRNR